MEDEINEKSNQQRKAASIMDHDFEKDKNIGKNKATRIQLASPYGASKSPNEKYRFDALNLVNKGTASTEEMDVKDEWGLYKDESFSDDSEGDERAKLKPGDGDDGYECVLQRMAEQDRAFTQAACACEPDVVGTQDFQHFGTNQTHDECHLVKAKRDCRKDQRPEPAGCQEPGGPAADIDGFATPEARQLVQFD